MSVSPDASSQQPQAGPRKPQPWLSMPGAPPQPDFAGFRQQMNEMTEKKRQLIDQLKTLQITARGDGSRNELDEARKEAREAMNNIESQRKVAKEERAAKNAEIEEVRKQRREASEKLRSLKDGLGEFEDAKEIDAAIAYLIQKMETSGGGLTAEKKTMKQVHQLEQAKSLLVELQPLNDSIQQMNEREVKLQQEYREFHERVGALNKEYEEIHQSQKAKDREARESGVNRGEIYKQCDALRADVNALNEKMNALRDEHSAKTAAWDTWKVEAREKYFAKMQAEREERNRRFLEKKNASKIEEKRVRAARRQNPYEQEINVCGGLITYLQDKKHMTQREEEERARKAAAAAFDPASAAPAGCVVLNESKWANDKPGTGPRGKAAKKQQKPQSQSKVAGNAPAATASANPGAIQHPEEKRHKFMAVGVEPPLTLAAIDEKIAELKARQKEYASHITSGELQLSSDDDEEEEAEPEVSETRHVEQPSGTDQAESHPEQAAVHADDDDTDHVTTTRDVPQQTHTVEVGGGNDDDEL